VRNLESSFEAVKEAGGHIQGAVVYTISPVHTLDHYVETAIKLAEMGADSICIKDMAALLTPFRTKKLVERMKKELDLPIHLHCHYIGGMAPMNYLLAIQAGVDIIDTATVPIAFGNSQPATEMVVAALKETSHDSGLDLEALYEIAEYFESVRVKRGFKRGVTSLAHMRVFSHQVPGGMISNLYSQLEEQRSLDRLDEVLEEIPRVRAEVGYPPLVTPLSQIVGTQAVLNVLTGKRWGIVPDEMKAYTAHLVERFPAVTTVVNNITERKSMVALGDREVVYHGGGTITEKIGNRTFRISANSFFQTNSLQARTLFDAVVELADFSPSDTVYDLYCGTGAIAIHISEFVERVVGIEVSESAVADAGRNAAENRVANCFFLRATLPAGLDPASEDLAGQPPPDVVVVDPPRNGLHAKLIGKIVRLAPQKVVYVSCNPATQARDVRLFADAGYLPGPVQPVDMFPHTDHIETVTVLRK